MKKFFERFRKRSDSNQESAELKQAKEDYKKAKLLGYHKDANEALLRWLSFCTKTDQFKELYHLSFGNDGFGVAVFAKWDVFFMKEVEATTTAKQISQNWENHPRRHYHRSLSELTSIDVGFAKWYKLFIEEVETVTTVEQAKEHYLEADKMRQNYLYNRFELIEFKDPAKIINECFNIALAKLDELSMKKVEAATEEQLVSIYNESVHLYKTRKAVEDKISELQNKTKS